MIPLRLRVSDKVEASLEAAPCAWSMMDACAWSDMLMGLEWEQFYAERDFEVLSKFVAPIVRGVKDSRLDM